MANVDNKRLARRLLRAKMAAGKHTKYGLGCGGFNPHADHPADAKRRCDCSGFALAWVFELSRAPKESRPWWIATETVYADATRREPTTFVAIAKPVPGCAVVYPDRGGKQGHCGIVTAVTFGQDGSVVGLRGIDCSASMSRKGDAIVERDFMFFLKHRPIYVVLKEDCR